MNDLVQRAKLAVWPTPAKFFHWLVVVLLIVAATLGFLADEQDLSPAKLKLFVTHKSFGLSVLLVMFLRVVWRVCSSDPEPVEGLSLMQQKLAGEDVTFTAEEAKDYGFVDHVVRSARDVAGEGGTA